MKKDDLVVDDEKEKSENDYVDKIKASLERIGDQGLKSVLLDTPLMQGGVTDTSTSDLRIRPFSLLMMKHIMEFIGTCSTTARGYDTQPARCTPELRTDTHALRARFGRILT